MNWQSGPGKLGDCVWALTAMRRIDGEHVFFCPTAYHSNLIDLCEDRAITLQPLETAPDAPCTWIGNMRFASQGIAWANHHDVIGFLTSWDGQMSIEAGHPRIFSRFDLLADWPEINRPVKDVPEFDALIINAQPGSGQVPRLDNAELETLIGLIGANYRTICTNPTANTNVTVIGKTISQIGALANRAKFVVAVGTGSHWAIHNVYTRQVPIYLLLDPYRLDYGDRQYPTHGLVKLGMYPQLINDGWLDAP